MARLDSEDVKPGKLAKPAKPPRGFPFRLLFYALLMTAAAGGAGSYGWKKRGEVNNLEGKLEATATVQKSLTECTTAKADTEKKLADASASYTALGEKCKQTEDQVTRIGADLSASKEELAALRTQRAEMEKRMKAVADIQAQFAKMTDTGQLQVSARRGSLVVNLPAEVLFPSGSSELSEDGKLKVLEVGFILKKIPDRRFLVVGHTDNVPLKGAGGMDNWQLSTNRALTVTRVLVQAGMKDDTLVAAGAGESDPLVKNESPQNRARNRRIEIQLMPALSELPPLPPSLEQNENNKPAPAPAPK
jgi:chemotaxis protein MotB